MFPTDSSGKASLVGEFETQAVFRRLGEQVRLATGFAVISGLCLLAAIALALPKTAMGISIPSAMVGVVLAVSTVWLSFRAVRARRELADYQSCVALISRIEEATTFSEMKEYWRDLLTLADLRFCKELISSRRADIETLLDRAEDRWVRSQRSRQLDDRFADLRRKVASRLTYARNVDPVLAARNAACRKLERVKARRARLEADVDELLKGASWWQKLNYDYPDYYKMDREIRGLEEEVSRFLFTNSRKIRDAEARFDKAQERSLARIESSKAQAKAAIPTSRDNDFKSDRLARDALTLGLLSVPVSAWNDISKADQVYSALRSVNGNYEGLSDFEIWLQCLTMPSESLVGLASLAKGALFEAHVADSTGGMLNEHFNAPDTDIVIDGVAYQIKATVSEAYIATVDPEIPVIATSEVAETTGAIAGGLENADLDSMTSLALGGTVVDGADTLMDAALSGLGGLGILATLRGINHTINRHREGISAEEAVEEGVGIAITGSMKATVDLAEMSYKAAMSRPSRFVGRQIARAFGGSGSSTEMHPGDGPPAGKR